MFVDYTSQPRINKLTQESIRQQYAAYRRLIAYDGFRRRQRIDCEDVAVISPSEFIATLTPKASESGGEGSDVEFVGVTRHTAQTPIDLTRRKKKFRYKMAERAETAAEKEKTCALCTEKTKKVSFGKRRRQIVKSLAKESGECEQMRVKVPLFDPITLQRIETPARGKDCKHISAFNLETFLSQFQFHLLFWDELYLNLVLVRYRVIKASYNV